MNIQIEKKKQYRKNGEDYIVSPYSLSWVDDNYYLVSYYSKYEDELTHFRVDRMSDINILEERQINIKEVNGNKDFNIAKYSKQIFNMFSGESENVQLLFHNNLINVVIDRFGEEVFICKRDEKYFTVNVEIAISTAFMAWLFQFGDKVKILSPSHIADEMKIMAEKVVNLYK
ncbi:MAG: helix-turn-helix transcriptional regulator [Ruminiclostridium sp.]